MSFNVGDKIKVNNPGHKFHNLKGNVTGFSNNFILIKLENEKRIAMSKRLLINETKEELTRKCLFENADALDEVKVTLDDLPDDIKELIEMGLYTEEEALAHIHNSSTKKCVTEEALSRYDKAVKDYIKGNLKEGEETTMKEIKNHKVVELYFERKVRELKKKLNEDIKGAEDIDPHKSFVDYLLREFNTYVENNADLDGKCKFEVTLPCTPECSKEIEKLRELSMDEVDKVHEMKHEVLTMLSGCDTYEQEMAVLRSYGIVSDKTVKMME